MLFSEPLHKTSLRVFQLQECVTEKGQVAVCRSSFVTCLVLKDALFWCLNVFLTLLNSLIVC